MPQYVKAWNWKKLFYLEGRNLEIVGYSDKDREK